ncbi:MAG: toll/interleukin-1 receptor domain-containing protein [Gemmatimonadales bacterium]
MAHDAFISYSTRDQTAALAVVHGLEAAGVRCWLAPRDIKAGDVWAQAIVEAIAAARVYVLIFSANANRSGHVVNELDAAVRKGAVIVPLRIEDVLPEGAMEFHLRTRHWLDAFGPDLARPVAELVATVKGVLASGPTAPPATEFGTIPPPPPPPGRILESTKSAFHLKVPKPGLSPRLRKPLFLLAAAIVAAAAVWRAVRGPDELTGVAFDVRLRTAGSEFRTTLTSQSIRFFESPRGVPALGSRTYLTRFAAGQTRFVNTEVRLHLEAPGRLLTVPLSCVIYDANGSVSGTFTLENRIAATATDWQSASGWGADKPGAWKAGRYRVDCRYGDKLIARGRFEVLD